MHFGCAHRVVWTEDRPNAAAGQKAWSSTRVPQGETITREALFNGDVGVVWGLASTGRE